MLIILIIINYLLLIRNIFVFTFLKSILIGIQLPLLIAILKTKTFLKPLSMQRRIAMFINIDVSKSSK